MFSSTHQESSVEDWNNFAKQLEIISTGFIRGSYTNEQQPHGPQFKGGNVDELVPEKFPTKPEMLYINKPQFKDRNAVEQVPEKPLTTPEMSYINKPQFKDRNAVEQVPEKPLTKPEMSYINKHQFKGLNGVEKVPENPLTKTVMSYILKTINHKLVELNASDVVVLRSDSAHPLRLVKTFSEMKLRPELLKAISILGFAKPSAIQVKALPILTAYPPQNMIAQSQSGTGKTATFLLAMLSRVNPDIPRCQCLCMVPTRELANQIASVCRKMAQFMKKVQIGVAIRGEEGITDDRGFVTSHIVVGTPGGIAFWLRPSTAYHIDPKHVTVFVLDEADLLMEQEGFLNISMRVKSKLPQECQTLLFSATYNENVLDFARDLVPNAIEIRVRQQELTLKNIKQYHLIFSDSMKKFQALSELYGNFDVGQAIIFCATRAEAKLLGERMTYGGHVVELLSAELDIKQREIVIERFRNADCRVLITTNLCSRGLDIPQVNLIINWNVPLTRTCQADFETYLHRIGRSGRFGNEGVAVTFITPNEKSILHQLEQHFGITIPSLTSEMFTNV